MVLQLTSKSSARVAVFALLAACGRSGGGGAADAAADAEADVVAPCVAACESPPCLLAAGQAVPSALAVDDEWIFWTVRGPIVRTPRPDSGVVDIPRTGSVMRAPKRGGAAVVLASMVEDPTHLVIDRTAVYWIAGGTVWRAEKDGTRRGEITFNDVIAMGAMAIDGDAIYFHGRRSAARPGIFSQFIFRTGKQVGTPSDVAEAVTFWAIALDATSVYATASLGQLPGDGAVVRAAKAGGTATVLARGKESPAGIAFAGGRVFFTTAKGIESVGVDGTGGRLVVDAAALGGGEPWALIAEGDALFWVESVDDGPGPLRRARLDGTDVTTLATGIAYARSLTLDRCAVYFTRAGAHRDDGSIWSTPR